MGAQNIQERKGKSSHANKHKVEVMERERSNSYETGEKVLYRRNTRRRRAFFAKSTKFQLLLVLA